MSDFIRVIVCGVKTGINKFMSLQYLQLVEPSPSHPHETSHYLCKAHTDGGQLDATHPMMTDGPWSSADTVLCTFREGQRWGIVHNT